MIDRDYLETLKREIDKLRKRISQLENQSTPTVPVYDSADFPINAVEGQVAIAPVSGSSSGSGIMFDTPNTGGQLDISTTGPGSGVNIEDHGPGSSGGIYINADDGSGAGGFIELGTADGEVEIATTVFVVRLHPGGDLEIQNQSGGILWEVDDDGGALLGVSAGAAISIHYSGSDLATFLAGSPNKISFFNVTPVAQQSTPTTLGDVIALLQAYGLST